MVCNRGIFEVDFPSGELDCFFVVPILGPFVFLIGPDDEFLVGPENEFLGFN